MCVWRVCECGLRFITRARHGVGVRNFFKSTYWIVVGSGEIIISDVTVGGDWGWATALLASLPTSLWVIIVYMHCVALRWRDAHILEWN